MSNMEITLYSGFKAVAFKGAALNTATEKLAQQAALYRSASDNYAAADKRVGYDTALILAEVEATKAYATDCKNMTEYFDAVGLDKHRASSLLTAGRIYRAANEKDAKPELKDLAKLSYDNLNTLSSMLKDSDERKKVLSSAAALANMTQAQVREWKTQNHVDKPKKYKDTVWSYRDYDTYGSVFKKEFRGVEPNHIEAIKEYYADDSTSAPIVEQITKDETGNSRYLVFTEIVTDKETVRHVRLVTAVDATPKATPKAAPVKVLTDEQAAASLGVDLDTYRAIKAQAIAATNAAKEATEKLAKANKRLRTLRK